MCARSCKVVHEVVSSCRKVVREVCRSCVRSRKVVMCRKLCDEVVCKFCVAFLMFVESVTKKKDRFDGR